MWCFSPFAWYYIPQMDDFKILHSLFSSRVRTKLLHFFFTMPDSSYFIRELERKIGEDAKNISRELNNLEDIGFLWSEKRGLQKFYSIKRGVIYECICYVFLRITLFLYLAFLHFLILCSFGFQISRLERIFKDDLFY